jgi:thiamine pyrophosphate-dependent acetolactate synthase large subunit-like protein
MKYKYIIKIHTVIDFQDLEELMNDYGSKGMRVTKVDDLGSVFEKNRPMKKFLLYIEQKIKK